MRPFIISFDHACNNRCRFCSQADLPSSSAAANLRERIEAARAAGHDELELVGGEPTLHDSLTVCIAAAKRLGFERIGLQTNGRRLAYGAYARALAADGLTHVDISLQGHQSALHEYHTAVPGSFKQTAAGIKRALQAGLRVAVTTAVTRSNMRHLAQIAEVLRILGVHHWRLRYVRHVGRATEDSSRLLPRWRMALPHLLEAHAHAEDGGIRTVVAGLPMCLGRTLTHADEDEPNGDFAAVCDTCAARTKCAGIDPAYLGLYGDAELVPFNENDRPGKPDGRSKAAENAPFVGGLGRSI